MPFDKKDLECLRKNDPNLTDIFALDSELGGIITTDDIKELIAAAKGNSHFESLTLNTHYISKEGVALIATELNLKKLFLRNCHLQDDELSELVNSRTIEVLDIGSNYAGESIKSITAIPTLTYLDAENSGIDDSGVIILANHHKLRYLNLYGNKITNKGAEILLENSLLVINLKANPFEESLRERVNKRAEQWWQQSDLYLGRKSPAFFQPAPRKHKEKHYTPDANKKSPGCDIL